MKESGEKNKKFFIERPEGGFEENEAEFERYQKSDEILIVDERNRFLVEI